MLLNKKTLRNQIPQVHSVKLVLTLEEQKKFATLVQLFMVIENKPTTKSTANKKTQTGKMKINRKSSLKRRALLLLRTNTNDYQSAEYAIA